MLDQYLQALILLLVAAATAGGLVAVSHLAGRVAGSRTKTYPYECGSVLIDKEPKRISIKFHLVAMMFILFDIEAAFLYPWAVSFRSLGLAGFVEMMVFIGVLLVGYVYIWRRGAFRWE
ncbi:MAG TPA: NADH-quinone oxidoreductase subunit A [Candidatus Polarisedimenticolia bacterium]|nr:NADH-quinone oxidoreductase subunit A [Candidatus Polarisedimenticolia bacterium]